MTLHITLSSKLYCAFLTTAACTSHIPVVTLLLKAGKKNVYIIFIHWFVENIKLQENQIDYIFQKGVLFNIIFRGVGIHVGFLLIETAASVASMWYIKNITVY